MLKKLLIISFIFITIAGGFWYFSKNKPQETEAAANKTGLVGWWTMDVNDATSTPWKYYDKSGMGNFATSTAAPTIVTGKIKQAVNLNGSSQYLSVNNSSSLNLPTFTVSAWIYLTSPPPYIQFIVTKTNGWDTNLSLGVYDDGYFYLEGRYPTVAKASSTVPNNTWTHVAGTFDGTNARLYMNGIMSGNPSAITIDTPTLGSVLIGQRSDMTAYYFGGKIDDVRIYNRVLSAQEVANLYSAAKVDYVQAPPKTTTSTSVGLVGYWTMDGNDTPATTTYDKSGFGNNGATMGFYTGRPATSTPGKIKQAISFDGKNGYITCGTSNTLNPSVITVSAWMKVSSLDNIVANYGLVSRMESNSPYAGYEIGLRGATSQVAYFHAGGTYASNAYYGSKVIDDGQWHLVTGVYDGTNSYIYIDGTADGPGVAKTNNMSKAGEALDIGVNYNRGTLWPGLIDDVRIYNYAFSAQEVANLYSAAKVNYVSAATKTGLVGYWTLDQNDIRYAGTATTTFDKSGFNNTGTFSIGTNTYGATSTQGQIKQALNFDGVNDYIDAGSGNSLKFGYGDYTVSAWAKYSAVQNYGAVVSYWQNDGGWYAGYQMRPHPDGVMHALIGRPFAVSYIDLASDNSLQDGKWHHLTLVNTGTTSHQFYVDGILNDSSVLSSTTVNQTLNNFYIGKLVDTASYYFNGSVDDVRIYNRALSAQEVANLYNSAWRTYR